jgi:hypothetical protein
MAALSTYLADKLLDHYRGLTSYSMPTVWMALTTTASSAGTPGTEAAYTGYARVALSGTEGAASAGSATNSSPISFAPCTGGTATIVGFATFDAVTAGNMLEFGTCSLSVSSGITPSFAAGAFVSTLA